MPIDLPKFRKRLARVSVSDLARLAEVDRSTVRRVRDGKTDPSVTIFNRLEAALKEFAREARSAKV